MLTSTIAQLNDHLEEQQSSQKNRGLVSGCTWLIYQREQSWFKRGSKSSVSCLEKKGLNSTKRHFLLSRIFDAEHQQLSQKMLMMLLWSLNRDLKGKLHQWDATQGQVGAQPC